MNNKKTGTEFLNVDLDITGEVEDVETFLKSIQSAVIVLNHAGRKASIELAKESASVEETVKSLVDFIGALEPEARSIWDHLESRRANVGIQAASQPHSACFAISAMGVARLAALHFEIVITVYAPATD